MERRVGRDNAVQMWVVQEILTPGMEYCEEADLGSQMRRIGFTILQEIAVIVYQNKAAVYDILLRAAAETAICRSGVRTGKPAGHTSRRCAATDSLSACPRLCAGGEGSWRAPLRYGKRSGRLPMFSQLELLDDAGP
jgi:hypothetical protein